MKNICGKLTKLIDVKSIVTICMTFVFSYLSAKGKISPDQFLTIFTTVIAFYFGTQTSKKASTENKNNDNNQNIE